MTEKEEKIKRKRGGQPLDLIGQRFGRLLVIERAEDHIDPKSGKHKTMWLCQCDCGNTCITRGNSLRKGAVKSCGCLHREISSITAKTKISHGKKYNKYDLSGEYGIGYTTKGEEFYFDLEDYDKIKDICWYMSKKGYVVGHIKGQKEIKMHRLIMGIINDQTVVVDHITTNHKMDNRKLNLRVTTQAKNALNRRLSKNNKSGYTGVSWNKWIEKWHSYIRYNNKIINLGYYKNKDEAINARKEAEIKYFGEYRYQGKE